MNILKTTALILAVSMLAISILAIFGAANIAAAQSTPIPSPIPPTEPTQQSTLAPIASGAYSESAGDHVVGIPRAPATMIIYASLTCPHCASWFNSVWPDIKASYVDKNKLRVVFREFPTKPANIAVIGFQIANCAPKDQYFSMIEHQMKEQENIFTSLDAGTGKETYLAIARKAGLDSEAAMNTCISSKAGLERINKSMTLAKEAGINSVPNFIINGNVYKGNSGYLSLAKHLDETITRNFSPIFK